MKIVFRVLPYLISQYFFYFLIIYLFGISNQSTTTHITAERRCSPSKGNNWSDSYDPDYFYHLTDVHITHYSQQTQDIFERALEIGHSYKSRSVLITGDLVDNYYLPYMNNDAQETKQMKEDWIEYHRVASKFNDKFERIIESFGNHDIPRILSFDSQNFFYSKYSMISKYHHNFTMINDSYDVFTDTVGNFTFLVLNPIFFPIPPLPFTYYVHAPTQYIDKVERIVNSIPDSQTVVVATHFQGPVWSESYCPFVKSASTERFFNSILQNKKVKFLVTGHNHGAGRMVMHHGDSFEVCASDLRENLRGGMVTNDNGNVVYHWFSIFKPSEAFVTFPVPVDQTTSRTECGMKKVRVISFGKNDKKMFVEIDNGTKVELSFVRKLNGDAELLEANLEFLPDGKHHLKLLGEEEEEFDFLFGPSSIIEPTTEFLYDDMLWAHKQWIGLIIFVVVFLIAIFPVKIFTFDGYWNWINKIVQSSKIDDIKYWFMTVFFGFFGIRSRLMKHPTLLRYLLFISVIISLFLPIFTFDVDGTYGFMFVFGYYLTHNADNAYRFTDSSVGDHYISRLYQYLNLRYEIWCPFLGFYYFAVAVVPIILTASSMGLMPRNPLRKSHIQVIDFAVQLGAIIGGLIICFDAFLLLCERKCALFSPFILFPVIWFIFIVFFVKEKRKNIKSINYEKEMEKKDINPSKSHNFYSY